MSELVIAEIAAPARDTDPGAVLTVLRKIHDFQQASDIARHGHDDQTEPVDLALGELQHNPNRPRFRLVALLDALPETMSIGSHGLPLLAADTDLGAATVVGVADLVLPMSDNRFAVWDVELEVDGGHRRRGIGRALAQAVDRVAVASERNLIQAWTNSSIAGPDDPDALVAPGSGYRLARDAGTRFALAMGYTLAQADRHSVQDLAGRSFTAPTVADYRIETWQDATDPRFLPLLADLQHDIEHRYPEGRHRGRGTDLGCRALRRVGEPGAAHPAGHHLAGHP